MYYFRSGFEKSGLICILLNEFERVRLKEEVNILETAKRMKERNANLIPDYVRDVNTQSAYYKCFHRKKKQ